MSSLNYSKLECQEYLKLENMSAANAKMIFKYRTRMASYGENFRGKSGPVSCPLCGLHLDTQFMGFSNCTVIKSNLNINGNYEDIFKSKIPNEVVFSIEKLDKFREEHMET